VSVHPDLLAEKKGPARIWIAVATFAAAFVAALFLDIPLSTLAHTSGVAPWLKEHLFISLTIRRPGHFLYTLAACAVLLWLAWKAGIRGGRELWEKPAIVLLAGILSGINVFLKWSIGRIRPYHGVPPFQLHPFGKGLIEAEASFSFPSGDASLAFAMAMSLTIVAPRQRILWWTLAIIVGVERVCENAHYPSDVVAGAALGCAVALAAEKIVHFLPSAATPLSPSPGTPGEGRGEGLSTNASPFTNKLSQKPPPETFTKG
jgi:membrane-associated phospholipid phosphatase